MKKTLLMASVACACAFAANAAYDSWFTGIGASATGTNAMDATNGAWVFNVTNGEASVESSALVFDLDDGETIVFNADQAAAPDTNTITRVAVTGVFTPVKVSDLPSDSEMTTRGAQVGFVVASTTENDVTTYNYKGWVGSGWITLGSAIPAANIESNTSLVVDFDYSQRTPSANYVTFSLVSGSPATTNVLSGGNHIAMTSTAAANRCVAGMTCYGSGTLAAANGDVEIGVATLNGVKYASISDAVAAASGTAEISVVRPTDEAVTVNKADITINDPNDIYTGNVAVDGVTTTVKPAAVEFTGDTLAGKSGTYTLKAGATAANIDDIAVVLPMSNKEVASKTVSGGKVQVTIQTATSVLAGATTDGGKALSVVPALRTFLTKNAQTAYEAAEVSSSTITAALNSTPENKNGLKLWQDYALGIEPEDSVKPVTAPAGDTDAENITLAIPDLVGKTPSGDYTISYKVGDTVQAGGAGAIKIPLTTGTVTGNKDVKVVFTP